jgi:hypothetical protein
VLPRKTDHEYRKEKRYRTDNRHKCFRACFHVQPPTNTLHLLGSDGTFRICPAQKHNQRSFRTLPGAGTADQMELT